MSNSSEVMALSEDDTRCDESKCISFGLSALFDYSYTCYADDNFPPMQCASGYIPHSVDTEPIIQDMHHWGTINTFLSYHYFTCCPPDLILLLPLDDDDVNVISRHCTNSSTTLHLNAADAIEEETDLIDNNITNKFCNDINRPYIRQMTNYSAARLPFVCCDSIIEQTNFLNETECVPFYDEFLLASWALNLYGKIVPITCNNKDLYSEFQFPRKVEKTNSYGIQYYECSKTGSKTSPPFIKDSIFKLTVYPQIAVSTIAVIFCMVIITAMFIPLWLYLRENCESTNNNNTTTTTNTRTDLNRSTNANLSTGSTRSRTTQRPTIKPVYSGYNLYLIYLAIPDMILNILLLGMCISYTSQKYKPTFSGVIIVDKSNNPFEGAFVLACSTANLYLNCVISYEVLILLLNSYNTTRCDPPSLFKVSFQAALVYLFAIVVFTIHYVIGIEKQKLFEQGNLERYYYLNNVELYWSLVVTYIFPIVFFGYVWITIWCRGYMPSTTGKMKQLVWYFFRIFIIFNVIWLPGMCLVVVGSANKVKNGHFICIGYLFCGIQPIVSTCMAMTKSDVRKYTRDLITLSYIRKATY